MKFFYILSFLLSICPLLLNAQKPLSPSSYDIEVDETEAKFKKGNYSIHTETGQIRSMYFQAFPTVGNLPEEKARHFMAARAEDFGFRDLSLEDIELLSIRASNVGQTLRFTQTYKGVPVYNTQLVVNINKEDLIPYVASEYRLIDLDNVNPSIGPTEAENIVYSYLPIGNDFIFQETNLVVYPFNRNRLAWQVLVHEKSFVGEWEVLIDAHTGEIFKARDRSLYHTEGTQATGNGNVFNPDPLSTSGQTYGGNYDDNNDLNNAELTGELVNVALLDIEFASNLYTLRGPYAEIRDTENPSNGLYSQASSTFNFNRNDDAFEAVNTYYHIDASMRYINVDLGCNISPYQYAGGARFDPHGLNGSDNSHYTGGNGVVAFGEGCVDDAEDSDVIHHELMHGIHDWVTTGGLSNTEGLSEGSADYWAVSYNRSLGLWQPTDDEYNWVFIWDGHNECWGGRVTNYGPSYPGGITNGCVHTCGQIWSTCMMGVFDLIGKTKTDKIMLEGLGLTNGSADQEDAAIAVLQAGYNMGYKYGDLITIRDQLTSCGYDVSSVYLEVELARFEAERSSRNTVDLNWETQSETNNRGFEIQRRFDYESEFEGIGFVEGKGNSDQLNRYAYNDLNNYEGISYYQLKMIDVDNGFSYSDVRSVKGVKNNKGINIYPNPFSSNIYILFEEVPETEMEISLYDLSGKEVLKQTADMQSKFSYSIGEEYLQLPNGVYFLEIKTNKGNYNSKLIKSN